MSIAVPVEDLAGALAGRPYAYFLTVSDDGRPHAVAVVPELRDGVLVLAVGRRTAANAVARPTGVSLVWPPVELGGYSLIADGAAEVRGDTVLVRPSKAVLHRPAPADAGPGAPGSCGSDCVSVDLP